VSESPLPARAAVAEGLAVAPCQVRQDEVETWVEDVQERVVAWLVPPRLPFWCAAAPPPGPGGG